VFAKTPTFCRLEMRWEVAMQTFVILNNNSENSIESNFVNINSGRSYCHVSEKGGEYLTLYMYAPHLGESLKF
jgi:hypothetical protein